MNILGVKIDNFSKKEVLNKVKDFLKSSRQHYIVTPNPEIIMLAQEDAEFKKILNCADLSIPDGVGLVLASRFLGQPLKERITGIDLLLDICRLAAHRSEYKICSVYLLGAEEGVAKRAGERLKKIFPNLQIVGAESGGMIDINSDNSDLIQKINAKKPLVIFVALGHGKQEKWITQNLKKMPSVKIAMGVGGAFDFISRKVRRAPVFLRKSGVEWLWRFVHEPWRAKRIWVATAKFSRAVITYRR